MIEHKIYLNNKKREHENNIKIKIRKKENKI